MPVAKGKASGTFTTENVKLSNRELKRANFSAARRTSRFVFSWMALMFGLFMIYTSLHYAPALFSPSEVLGVTSHKTSGKKLDNKHVLSPLVDLFRLKRGYFHEGQTLSAQYKLPPGATADLVIIRCKRMVIVEVFSCEPVASQRVQVADGTGAREFRVGAEGFYFVDDKVNLAHAGDPYTIVWQRT